MTNNITEARIIGHASLPDVLWANGTTTHRFNFDGETGFFVNPHDPKNRSEINASTPLFLTTDVDLMLSYIQSHFNGDSKISDTPIEGLAVFVGVKPGTNLFDFTDPNDFAEVFNNKIDNPQELADIFKECEPYFAFNSSIANSARGHEPIEFKIARYMAIYFSASTDAYTKSNGNIKLSFFE
jgi:hypothetical protein